MGYLSSYPYRIRRKVSEHFARDPSGISFLRYTLKYFIMKIMRRKYIINDKNMEALPGDRINVAVRITGGLGDTVILARVLRDIANQCSNCCFYIFSPSLKQSEWVFSECNYVADVLPSELFDYYKDVLCDCTLFLNSFAYFYEERINFEKIRRLSRPLLRLIATCRKGRSLWNVFIDNHPVLDGAFARQAIALGLNRYTFIYNQLGLPPPADFKLDLPLENKLCREIRAVYPDYITFNTGFDQLFIMATRTATKCYPKELWQELIRLLKRKFPQTGIIQVGGGNSTLIPGADMNFSGKTTFSECAGILKESRLHIDIEGGLVHVCASLGTRCAVLFGPTSKGYFAYPENMNLRDNACDDCWWATERWMECCPKKYSRNECMYKLNPAHIADAIQQFLLQEKTPC